MTSLNTTSPARIPAAPDGAAPRRRSLALIGAGAFGAFCIPHLRRYFTLHVCDALRDVTPLCDQWDIAAADLATAARQDIVVLAVPLHGLRAVARGIAPLLRPGAIVVDVCSVKTEPLAILAEELPDNVHLVGTHPLFGPQSGRNGISGLRIAVCDRGARAQGLLVARFLRRHLALDVIRTTADEHDRQMAYIQGLTHLLGRVAAAMDMPPLTLTTASFGHLSSMVEMVRHDSDALFRTIVLDNPYGPEVMRSFVEAARDVLKPIGLPSHRIL